MKIISKALSSKPYDLVEAVVYHGFRSHKKVEVLKKQGFEYYHSSRAEAERDVREILERFGFEMPFGGVKAGESPNRWHIYVTVFPEGICSYARRSPEAVTLTLEAVGKFSREEIEDLVSEKYGVPLVAVLRLKLEARRIVDSPFNVDTGRSVIKPSEILGIIDCI